MVYILKTHPFSMTFEEIKNMTFGQATFLIEEMNASKTEAYKRRTDFLKRNGKEAFPTFDVTEGIN